jgi:hypothetical protein
MATKAQVNRALENFQLELNQFKNVVGLGIVPADEGDAKNAGKELAVGVYVSKKVPLSRLAAKDRIPETLRIQGKGGELDIPVRVIEQGVVEKESAPQAERL